MSHTASLAWILLAAGSLLTSCTAPPQATAPQAAATAGSPADAVTPLTQPIGFHCPPRGTFSTNSLGSVVTYLGVDPAASDICIGRNGAGSPVQQIRGIWIIGSMWPDSIPGVRDALAKLTTLPPGAEVTMSVTGKSSNPDDPRAGTWTHTMKVHGEQTLTVPAGTFRTVLIVDHERGRGPTGYDGTHDYWVDRNTGLPVKRRTESSSPGKTSDWEMTSLRVPQ
jgi:hypothetical protein